MFNLILKASSVQLDLKSVRTGFKNVHYDRKMAYKKDRKE